MKSLYINNRVFLFSTAIVLLFFFSEYYPWLFALGEIGLFSLITAIIIEYIYLYKIKSGIEAERTLPEKLSNGDKNSCTLILKNNYPFKVEFEIIEELPIQLQERNFSMAGYLKKQESIEKTYNITPKKRGEYIFGFTNIFISGPAKLIKRRFKLSNREPIPCYPAFLQLRKYEMYAATENLEMQGIKKMRRLGNQTEFEKINEYVPGDDYRTINWKATARVSKLMVNKYSDEKAQNVICLLDMGRRMEMPFNNMTLLDYAINSTLIMAGISIRKEDKPGMISFSDKIHTILPPDNSPKQKLRFMELLYKQSTEFNESNYELLYSIIRTKIKQRSLLVLYTNFESSVSLEQNLSYLRAMAQKHVLIVVFFKNTQIYKNINKKSDNIEEIYEKTICEKLIYDKYLIQKELSKYGIYSVLTRPEDVFINTLNKYLEIKSRGII